MKKTLQLCSILTLAILCFSTSTLSCKASDNPIHLIVNNTIPADFTSNIYHDLETALSDIGYCLQKVDSSVLNDTSKYDELIIYLTPETNELTSGSNLLVCLPRVQDWAKKDIDVALEHPLISISYQPNELNTFQSVLVKKIVENIRTQYVCQIRIQSNPEGVFIATQNGLEGKTPLEWIVPVGSFTVKGKKDGYEPFHKKLDFAEPGIHTYFLELKKKQFYNSKFLYPTIIFGLASAASYAFDRYYYNQYLKLGKTDYYNHPEKFQSTYNKAYNFEKASLITLACTAISFTCTFVFK